ncbi:hypothetical protein D3C87_630730 [compost metagenome]
MVHPAAVQRIAERTDHVFLAHQLGKTLRTPLAGKDEIGHQATVFIGTSIVPRLSSPPALRFVPLVRLEFPR